VSEPFPEPTIPASSRTEVFLRYLDYFRARVTAKLDRVLLHLMQEYARHLGQPVLSATQWLTQSPRPSIQVRSTLPGCR